MITMYHKEGIDHWLYELVGVMPEDCRERQLITNLMHWLTGEALSLLEKPIKLIAVICLWWPVDLC